MTLLALLMGFTLQVRIFERGTHATPRAQYTQVGGVLMPNYGTGNPLNQPVPFADAGQVELFPSENLSLERLDVNDASGGRAAYCNDLQLGLMASWAYQHHIQVIPLDIIRTKDGSAPAYALVENGPGCDGFQ